MTRMSAPRDDDDPSLLDPDTWEVPRRMTRREGALSAGSDWSWTQPHFQEDDLDD